MKLAFLSIIIFTLIYSAHGQQNATIKIIYNFEHVRDTTNPTQRYKEQFALYVGTNESVFLSRTREISDSQMNVARLNYEAGRTTSVEVTRVANTTERIYTSYPLKMHVKTSRIQSNTYATPLKMEKIDWVVSADVKTVAELTCMKAVGSFGGRTYTVWFTTAIAVPLGPWKLHGLPGVILEAVDSKGQVSFKAAEILRNIPPYNTELPKNFIAASQNDIEKLMKAKENGASIGSGGDISIAGVKLEGGTQGQKKPLEFNNPLELKQ